MKRTVCIILSILLVCSAMIISAGAETMARFTAVTYPTEAVTQFVPSMTDRVSTGDDYISNQGYDETGLYVSPYWTAQVNGVPVKTYGVMTYDFVPDTGVVHSFSRIKADLTGGALAVTLKNTATAVNNAVVLPAMYGVDCTANGSEVTFTVTDYGDYTVLINDDDQRYVFTLFVDEMTDENAEIAELQAKYGADRVLVFENKYYELDTVDTGNYDAVYFRAGSYIKANHIYDIESEEEFEKLPARQTFITVYGRNGFEIKGDGVIDLTALDRKEREGLSISWCSNVTVEGLTFINPPSWTVITHGSENLDISGITVFGYRTNSDGINICCSNNVTVSDSYMRNGDDCYSVKTTTKGITSHDITFDNCIAYSTKARCFGITGEVESDIYNVTYKNSAVIYRDATWDNDRVSSIAVQVESGEGQIDNITFENIEIHKDLGRAINIIVYSDDISNCKVTGITLKNITCDSGMKSQITSKRNMSFTDKVNSLFYRIFNKFAPDSAVTEFFASKCSGNEITVNCENVEADFETNGNVNLTTDTAFSFFDLFKC